MYPPELVAPMRAELTSIGVRELRTPGEVDEIMNEKTGTTLVVVNSVCGCAAGNARPAVAAAIRNESKPDRITTVFAGADPEVTAHFRSLLGEVPPSSPSIFLFKDGELVFFLPRHMIEGRDARTIAGELVEAFNQNCKSTAQA